LHPSGPNSNLGDADTFGVLGPYAVKYVDEQAKTGRYCVLINGATDAAFSIVRAKWTSATAAEVTMMDRATSIAIEGDLEISEPKGVVFLDILVNCCLALQVDAANVVFVLKTFFVGHSDSDSVSTEEAYITTVEPLRFIAYDISGSFAETGGLYQMSFVALAHGASRLPQFGKSASGFNITGGTLYETFANLAGVVKQNYDDLFDCVKKTVTDPHINALLSPVEYEFELDDVYNSSQYKVSDAPQQVKDRAGCVTEVKVPIPANMSIEDAIHLIMRKCPQITDEMANGVQVEGGKPIHYEYKIHTAVRSTRVNDRVFYTVVYRVQRFMRPKDVSLFDLAAGADGSDLTQLSTAEVNQLDADSKRLRNNLISFDYIYTGKNIDILEFEMKLNMGLAYLQIATINNTLKDQLQAVPTAVSHVPLYEQDKMANRFGGNRPTQIPVFFGTQIRQPSTRNKQQLSDNAEAAYTMNKHASIEVQDVTMKIYGNPSLLSSVNRISAPENIGTSATPQSDNPDQRVADYPDFGAFPAFAKINIKMPRNNDDISLFRGEAIQDPQSGIGSADFARDFWFTGFYYVVGIQHIFEAGEFTQEMSLIGIPQTKAFKAVNKFGQNPQDIEAQKGVLSCYDSRVDLCAENKEGSQSTAAPQAGPETAATRAAGQDTTKTVALEKRSDIDAATKTIDPNTVPGWKTAPADVKASITSAAQTHGVDEGYLAAIAQKESSFNPTARAKTSSATGLFQFTDKTWDDVVAKHKKELGLQGADQATIRAARNNPAINSQAAALLTKDNQRILERRVGNGYKATPSDLYLAHFMGVDAAGKVIAASNTNPNTSVSDAIGAKRYQSYVTANPSYRKYQTVDAWRTHNAKGLDPNVSVVQSARAASPSPNPGTTVATSDVALQSVRVAPNVRTKAVKAATKVERLKDCPTKDKKTAGTTSQAPCTQTHTSAAPKK
jgi:hypothetical protein